MGKAKRGPVPDGWLDSASATAALGRSRQRLYQISHGWKHRRGGKIRFIRDPRYRKRVRWLYHAGDIAARVAEYGDD